MKLLGIDYGKKRVGIAISDDEGALAFPHSVLDNKYDLVSRIKDITKREGVDEIVVGESMDFSGVPNPIMAGIKNFVLKLNEQIKIPVHLEPEFLSSVQAENMAPKINNVRGQTARVEKRGMKKISLDTGSAVVILQSFIDKKKA